jgi:uncharacterized protein (DUF305 family)
MVRHRLGWWLLVAVLAAGCTTSDADQRPGSDHTDIWFAQHMVPHLLQTSAILDLAGDQLTGPKLARLAGTINRQSQADLQQLQGWLEGRGLAAYDPQQDPNYRKATDLSRLSRTHGAGFDRAFSR